MGWLIALAVLVMLGFLPLGVKGVYDASGAFVDLLIGPIRIPIYPKKKEKKKKEEGKSKKETDEATEKKGGSYKEFLPLIRVLLDFLKDFCRKIRVKRLEMLLCLGGDDPCDLAINYGKAWAAIGNLMPQLERFFVIKKRNLQVRCDFDQIQTTIYVRADITITLGRLLALLLRYGWRACKEYFKMIDERKGGAQK